MMRKTHRFLISALAVVFSAWPLSAYQCVGSNPDQVLANYVEYQFRKKGYTRSYPTIKKQMVDAMKSFADYYGNGDMLTTHEEACNYIRRKESASSVATRP